MRIEQQDKQRVVIVVPPKKASALLAGLKAHAAVLGETAAELATRLEEAGVSIPPSEPPRYEFRPPDEW